jgi:Zn-finger nucleic acid-binding protein
MKCPACDRILEAVTVENMNLDVCKGGCGGIWFDRFELQKVHERRESAGEALLDIEKDAGMNLDHDKRRKCPKCADTIMMRHFHSVKKEVEVDECPKCDGIWLDYGELRRIRTLFGSEEERKRAAREYFSEVFGNELARMREESHEKGEKARRIARIFRFISPSYYIPGKQDWGAF